MAWHVLTMAKPTGLMRCATLRGLELRSQNCEGVDKQEKKKARVHLNHLHFLFVVSVNRKMTWRQFLGISPFISQQIV